ncbi:MAG: penicillin-binding protein 2, partial [Planctomycetota bacterium]
MPNSSLHVARRAPKRPPAAHEPTDLRRARVVGSLLLGVIVVAFVGLLGRTAQLQVAPDERTVGLLERQSSPWRIEARRGDIVDRHGRVLATSARGRMLFADPALIADFASFGERVGYGLGVEPADIDRTLGERLSRSPGTRFVPLIDSLTDEQIEALPTLGPNGRRLAGLATQSTARRHYPQGALAGQVIGFVGVEHTGLAGMEATFDARLTGVHGSVDLLRDRDRQPLWTPAAGLNPPRDGQAVRLTIDATIQAIAEEELARAVEAVSASQGQVVVMDPHTGELLAIANYPTFDPADFRDPATKEAKRNRVATDTFEPGSIFKPFVWAGLTQRGAAKPSDFVDCEQGWWVTPYGRTLLDAKPIGPGDWDHVLVKSSNIGMAKVAAKVSEAELREIIAAYGFGQGTGSGLPGEVVGVLHPLEKWSKYSPSSLPMGHEVSVTPLQIVRAFAAIASDGVLPTLSVTLPEHGGPTVIRQRVLDPAVALHTRQVLRRVVEEGT